MTTQQIPTKCPRCGGRLLLSYDELVCSRFCGWDGITITKEKPKAEAYVEELAVKPLRRIHGISAKESRRIYRNTPAGRAAWDRYRYSELFYEAHARHRLTPKYKETQRRFHEKQRLFRKLLRILNGEEPESTCPLNLFFKGPNGETYHSPELCDFNNKDDNDCTLTCLNGGQESENKVPESKL